MKRQQRSRRRNPRHLSHALLIDKDCSSPSPAPPDSKSCDDSHSCDESAEVILLRMRSDHREQSSAAAAEEGSEMEEEEEEEEVVKEEVVEETWGQEIQLHTPPSPLLDQGNQLPLASTADTCSRSPKERNRQAQQRFRERQKAIICTLHLEIDSLRASLLNVNTHAAALQEENTILKALVEQQGRRS